MFLGFHIKLDAYIDMILIEKADRNDN
jgi:hypothetical protein